MTTTGIKTPSKMANFGDESGEDVTVGVSSLSSGVTVVDSTEMID